MFERYTEDAREVVVRATDIAKEEGSRWVTLSHLAKALGPPSFTGETKKVFDRALRVALRDGKDYIDAGHLRVALSETDD